MTVSRIWSAAVGALALLAAAQVEAAGVTRGPFLQSVSEREATVVFRLDTSCAALVRLEEEGGAARTAASSSPGAFHAVALSDLAPGRSYRYSVEACGAPTGASGSFRTPKPAELRTVHFGVVGDSGTGGNDQEAVVQRMLAEKPEMIVTVGDNAYSSGTDAELQSRFFEPMAPLLHDVPLFPAMGNHEYVTSDGKPYLDAFVLPTNNPQRTERYYSFDWGSAHFVVLDSSCATGYSDSCTLVDQQLWMEQDLRASKADWKIVIFHHPPYSSGEHGSQLKLRQSWGPILESAGVDLVLTGHDHNYERSKPMKGGNVTQAGPGAPTYLVVGNGGANLRAWTTSMPSWSAYRNNTDYGFLDVKISGGTLSAQMKTASGAVADSFTLRKTLGTVTPKPDTGSSDGGTPASTSGGTTGSGSPTRSPLPDDLVVSPDTTLGSGADGVTHPDDDAASGCGSAPLPNTAGRSLWLLVSFAMLWGAARRRRAHAFARIRRPARLRSASK